MDLSGYVHLFWPKQNPGDWEAWDQVPAQSSSVEEPLQLIGGKMLCPHVCGEGGG